MTYIIAEPCIDIKTARASTSPRSTASTRPSGPAIDPEERIDCGACEPECPVEAIFPEDSLSDKRELFVNINYAYGEGLDVVNTLTNEYATEYMFEVPPLTPRSIRRALREPFPLNRLGGR